MTDSLLTAKQPDGFTHESPIRAFIDFQVDGQYAIGKGFRPSITHLSRYLDAMDRKEGWALVQIIMPDNDAADPTIVFRKTVLELTSDMALPHTGSPPVVDAIRPKHYNGDACAQIIEHMPANVALAFKYIWRLFEKDEPRQEIGKALFYLERERALFGQSNRGRTGFASVDHAAIFAGKSRNAVLGHLHGKPKANAARQEAMLEMVGYTAHGGNGRIARAIATLRRLESAL